jgi:hypothetical protein
MAAWLTIYCRRPCTLGAVDLAAELDAADLLALAEAHQIDEAFAVEARPRFEPADVPLGGAELFWKEGTHRPLVMHRWSGGRAREELAEARARHVPPELEPLLDDVVEVIGIEMASSSLSDLGVVLAWEIARIIGHASVGFARDDEDQWSILNDAGGWEHL